MTWNWHQYFSVQYLRLFIILYYMYLKCRYVQNHFVSLNCKMFLFSISALHSRYWSFATFLIWFILLQRKLVFPREWPFFVNLCTLYYTKILSLTQSGLKIYGNALPTSRPLNLLEIENNLENFFKEISIVILQHSKRAFW